MGNEADQNGRDVEAVVHTLRGDTEAFRWIVESYEPVMRHLALKYLRQTDRVEDAVQEVFLKAFKSLHRFDTERRFLPWLYGVALNHLKSVYRRTHRTLDRERPMEQPVKDDRDTPERSAERRAAEEAVRHAVDVLPASLRDVVVLYYLEEMSVEDVGAALGLGKENVKSRLHRARKKLRTILAEDATE